MKRLLITLLSILAATSANATFLEGQTVGYQYIFPDSSSLWYNAPNVVVGSGIEYSGSYSSGTDVASVDIADTSITFDYYDLGSWNSASFNGFRLYDVLGTIGDFTSVTLDASSNMVGLTDSNITFDANNIYVNWQGLEFTDSTVVKFNINGASNVPEPTSIALLGMGLAGLGFSRRKAKNQ